MKKEERQDRIERYLRRELSPAEQAQFEEALKQDAVLAEEVRLHRQLQDEFGDRAKQDFIKTLDTLGDRYFGPSPASGKKRQYWQWLLGALLIVVVGLWLVIWGIPTPAGQQEAPVPERRLPQEAPEAEERELPAPADESADPPPAEPSRQEKEREPAPIAQLDPADFTPNPYLENLVGSYVRGEEWQFSGVNAALGKGRFRLEGQVQLTATAARGYLLVFVYSNREADWLDGNFLLRRPLELQAIAAEQPGRTASGEALQSFRFLIDLPVDWKPGLYYYFLAWEQDEEPLFAGKTELTSD